AGMAPADKFRCAAKVRYRQKDQSCEVEVNQDGSVNVTFDQPQKLLQPLKLIAMILQKQL
ncbi:aminomethyltransferase beta-barrel domain-containing protein, partial [Francisella tularensis]|uniref:aminomethyltransferase beta-barrel domain-containing protein n=1 Tax=Francisella tularensis TaxID=263 RepID=UPI0010E49D27